MIKYKLTDQNMQTHGGFQWVLGKKEVITSPGATLCSDQVFHYYASPEQAVLLNPVHAGIRNPRLFTAEIDKEVVFDGLKGGCHEMTLVKELTLPTITLNQRVEIAIRLALTRCHNPCFTDWANNWLSGADRSAKAARAAARAAADWAERSAAWAAEAEVEDAANWVAWAFARGNAIGFKSIINEVLYK